MTIEFGKQYRDSNTGFIGVADAVTRYQHGCERVRLRALLNGAPVEHWFDAPGVAPLASGQAGFQQ